MYTINICLLDSRKLRSSVYFGSCYSCLCYVFSVLLQLWRVSESEFQFRTLQGQFLTCDGEGCSFSATAESPSTLETFYVEKYNNGRVHIKTTSGTYLQVWSFLLWKGWRRPTFLHLEWGIMCFHAISSTTIHLKAGLKPSTIEFFSCWWNSCQSLISQHEIFMLGNHLYFGIVKFLI